MSVELLIVVVVLGLLIGIALQRTFYRVPVLFNWYALRDQWVDLAAFLLVGWLAARFARPTLKILTLPIALFTAVILVDVVFTAVWHVGTRVVPDYRYFNVAVYYGWHLWFFLIVLVLLRRTARLDFRYVALAALPVFLLSGYDIVFPSGGVWYALPPQRPDVTAPHDSPVSEEMLYLQPRLLRQTLEAVVRQRPGVADLYFVGFAPYAREDVFMKEAEAIRDLMDRRFDTEGRSVLLVNNDRTLRKYPLATVTNLRAVLKRIGRRINRREDVVVLYLTSHGGKDHRLSADYWPLDLDPVSPTVLRQLLDDAGIRWRVIVVSACYAGGFIEPLRSPTTLVMTAADANHTSFGCGATSQFTYFGKALFDEQLRETHSFERAFRKALPVIREREDKLGEGHSNPQIAMGAEMRAKLAAVERRLERTSRR